MASEYRYNESQTLKNFSVLLYFRLIISLNILPYQNVYYCC